VSLQDAKSRPPVLARVGFQNSATVPDLALLCGSLIFADQAAKDGPTLDSLLGRVRDRMIGPGRAELAAAVGAPPVVMGLVLGQDRPQVPFAKDEHPVGELCPGVLRRRRARQQRHPPNQADEHQVEHPHHHEPAMLPATPPATQANPQASRLCPVLAPCRASRGSSAAPARSAPGPGSAASQRTPATIRARLARPCAVLRRFAQPCKTLRSVSDSTSGSNFGPVILPSDRRTQDRDTRPS
jgi:hypothetical protein